MLVHINPFINNGFKTSGNKFIINLMSLLIKFIIIFDENLITINNIPTSVVGIPKYFNGLIKLQVNKLTNK